MVVPKSTNVGIKPQKINDRPTRYENHLKYLIAKVNIPIRRKMNAGISINTLIP